MNLLGKVDAWDNLIRIKSESVAQELMGMILKEFCDNDLTSSGGKHKIHAPNMKYYQEFILNVLGTIDSLGSLESTFVMAEVKHRYGIHI